MKITHGFSFGKHSPVALTVGNFDGVHLGHRAMIEKMIAAARALRLPACILLFEPHPREFFAPQEAPPRLTSLREKLEIFAALGADRVHVCRFDRAFSRLTAEQFCDQVLRDGLHARWLLVGDDFRFGAGRAGDIRLLKRLGKGCGFEASVMASVNQGGKRISSTAVRDALAAGDLRTAERLLGRCYSMSGRVVHGDKVGRKLGFPTANILVKHTRPPLSGIFAVEVEGWGKERLPGVASLGVRPTFKNDGKAVLEVHLFDFDRQLYGRHIRVQFREKLRDEEKYPDSERLILQIRKDVEMAKDFFEKSLSY